MLTDAGVDTGAMLLSRETEIGELETAGELTDRLNRSLGILKFARRMSSEEMMRRLSDVKLGLSIGLFEGMTAAELDKLATLGQPASIASTLTGSPSSAQRDEARAKLLRVGLKECKVF